MNWQLWKDRLLGKDQLPSGPNVPLILPDHAGESLQRTVAQARKDKKSDQICIAICGCRHSAGTSTIALNLVQQAAASMQENVLLVEANRRTPVFADYYDLKTGPGVTDWLAGKVKIDEVIHAPDSERHRVVACTDKVTDLSTADFESKLKELRNKADLTFIDLPPALLYAETAEISAHVDGVILVIQADQDKWEAASATKDLLVSAGATLFGVILNRKEYFIPDWLFRHL